MSAYSDVPRVRERKFRRQTPDARRRALINATIQCIVNQGLEKTSSRNIAETAGVSIGLINHYYSSKDDLIADVYQQVASDLQAEMDAQVDAAEGGARARLSAFLRAAFSAVNLDPTLFRVWLAFWTMAQKSAPIAEVHHRTYATYRQTLERLLGELAEEQAFQRLDVRLAAIGLSGLLDGLWLEWCLNPDTFSPDEGVMLCETWLDGLLRTGLPTDVA